MSYIFGKKYEKKVIFDSDDKIGITVKNHIIVYNSPTAYTNWNQDADRWLERFIKQAAIHYISQKTQFFAQKMQLEYKSLKFKKQKTRWGSCSSKANLNFNWKLGHFPPPIIDYVIIHELCHLVHMDHSRNFWQLVAKWDSSFRSNSRWLKKNGRQYSLL